MQFLEGTLKSSIPKGSSGFDVTVAIGSEDKTFYVPKEAAIVTCFSGYGSSLEHDFDRNVGLPARFLFDKKGEVVAFRATHNIDFNSFGPPEKPTILERIQYALGR